MNTTVEIPQSMFIPCPAASFKNRRAARCADCAHFQGIHDAVPETPVEIAFERRYRVVCAHPIGRSMIVVEED